MAKEKNKFNLKDQLAVSAPDLTPLAKTIGDNKQLISNNMTDLAVLEKEIELLKLQLEEIKVSTSNPLTSNNSGN